MRSHVRLFNAPLVLQLTPSASSLSPVLPWQMDTHVANPQQQLLEHKHCLRVVVPSDMPLVPPPNQPAGNNLGTTDLEADPVASVGREVFLPVVTGLVDGAPQRVVLMQDVADRLLCIGGSTARKCSVVLEQQGLKLRTKDHEVLAFLAAQGLLRDTQAQGDGLKHTTAGKCREINLVPVARLEAACRILCPKRRDLSSAIGSATLVDPAVAQAAIAAAVQLLDATKKTDEVSPLVALLTRHKRCKRADWSV